MKRGLKNEFTLLFSVLFIVILTVWAFFYIVMSNHIYANTERHLTATAGQIVDDLGNEFANLERVCYALSTQPEMNLFVSVKSTEERLHIAGNIDRLLQNGNFRSDLASHILAVNKDGRFYRFRGKLSNTSAARLCILADTMNIPTHISIELENTKYVGYATDIYNDKGVKSGTLMMFTEEDKLLDMLYMYSPDNSLFIGIAADGKIVSANSHIIPDLQSENQKRPALIKKHIGITPFEIIVAADKSQLSASTYYFSVAAVLTVVSFMLVLYVFARIQNRRFLSPMLKIIDSTESVSARNGAVLPLSGSLEFDRLIEKINAMLQRIEKQNEEIIASGMLLKNAEIAKQKAVIFSLKKQINAHFTINTLSTIKILLEQEDYERADHILAGLSAMIHYAFDKDEFIKVWDEMCLLEKYVDIMNVRYNNKITFILEVDDRLMDVCMPRMLLQPIAENSIIHGFHDKIEGVIEVIAVLEGNRMRITVRDNGHGIPEDTLQELNAGLQNHAHENPAGVVNIALLNIKKRLYSYYGNDGTITITSTKGDGTEVVLSVCLLTGVAPNPALINV